MGTHVGITPSAGPVVIACTWAAMLMAIFTDALITSAPTFTPPCSTEAATATLLAVLDATLMTSNVVASTSPVPPAATGSSVLGCIARNARLLGSLRVSPSQVQHWRLELQWQSVAHVDCTEEPEVPRPAACADQVLDQALAEDVALLLCCGLLWPTDFGAYHRNLSAIPHHQLRLHRWRYCMDCQQIDVCHAFLQSGLDA